MSQLPLPQRKTIKFKGFDVESVLGTKQFAQGWHYFGDRDFEAVDMWHLNDFQNFIFSTKDKMDEQAVLSVCHDTLYPIFQVVHKRMCGYENNEMIRARDVLDLCIHLHFTQYPDLMGSLPDDFFLASEDGLRLLYRKGKFKSLMLDKKFYLVQENGAYHCGHFMVGTWAWVHDMSELIAKTLGRKRST